MGKWLGIADETVFGTPVTPPTVFIDCASIDLHPERVPASVVTTNLIGPSTTAIGQYNIRGEVEVIPNSFNIAKLLKFLLGTPTSVNDGGGRWKHTYLPSDTLKWGTMYKVDDQWPDGTNALQYISTICTSMRLEAALNAFVSTRFGLLGLKDAKVAKPTVGTFNATDQFFSLDGKMYWDITGTLEETNIAAVSLTYTREIPDDFLSMNEAFLRGFIPGNASVEGSVDLIFANWLAYEKFWGGSSGPAISPLPAAMMFDFTGAVLGGTGDYDYHRLKIKLPAVTLPSINEPVEGRDKIIQTVNFQANRGTVEAVSAICSMILTNTATAT